MPGRLSLAEKAHPKHTALLVIDMQQGYEPPAPRPPGGLECLPQLRRLLEAARQASVSIIFIRNVTGDWWDLPNWKTFWQEVRPDLFAYVREDSVGSELLEGLSPRPEEPLLVKHYYSAFAHGPLSLMLRSRGIKSVLLTGGGLLGAVDCAAKEAFVRGYHVVLVKDCVFPQSGPIYPAVVENFAFRLGWVTDSATLMGLWGKPSA